MGIGTGLATHPSAPPGPATSGASSYPITMANKPTPKQRLLTTEEARAYLGVSRRKLETWVQTGFLSVVRLDGFIRRFDITVLDEIIEANTRNGEARR
ncbi:MAG: hypothetical protein CMM84_19490 [Rhodothermaceae bacterium]|nr:hypothetical protein [Rhodothermaceae bacterium]MBC12408.1 hypothetical protein [Rhodothermaceae bacterium]